MRILFDCGATNLRMAIGGDQKTFKGAVVLKTPGELKKAVELIAQTALELSRGRKIKSLAGGITGFLDNTRGQKTAELLTKKLGTPALVENDTALVGLGEAHFGAARGFSIAVYLTVSTGVGGVRIVDDKIDRSAQGFEVGHQIIRFAENRKWTLEELVSGRAVKKRFGQDPKQVKDKNVWNELAYQLAIGVYNSILHWSPELVVLGGPMILGQPAISLKLVEQHLKKLNKIFPKTPPVRKAQLGQFGGLYGALILTNSPQERI